MKPFLLMLAVFGLAAQAPAQGYIALDNLSNTDTSPSATSNGLFLIETSAYPYTGPPTPIRQDFNAAFYGGTDSSHLTLIASFYGQAAQGDNAGGPGTFFDPTGQFYPVPGTSSSSKSAWFRVEMWTGYYTTFQAAQFAWFSGASGAYAATRTFVNPIGPGTPPPLPPRLSVALNPGGATFELTFFAATDNRYQVQTSADLTTWTNLGARIQGAGANYSITYSTTGSARSFYRVQAFSPGPPLPPPDLTGMPAVWDALIEESSAPKPRLTSKPRGPVY